jgi:hypothetical protein
MKKTTVLERQGENKAKNGKEKKNQNKKIGKRMGENISLPRKGRRGTRLNHKYNTVGNNWRNSQQEYSYIYQKYRMSTSQQSNSLRILS